MRKKVCIITCYKDPNYIRGRTIRAATGQLSDEFEIINVKNTSKGMLRYFEVLKKLIAVRIKHKPDIYLLTFRGYEILPFVRLITLGRPLIFDEFINLIEWLVYEHKKVKKNGVIAKLLFSLYRSCLKSAQVILTDTPSHAQFSSEIMRIPLERYAPLPVSTDEGTFIANTKKVQKNNQAPLAVFYYGSMLPLHGVGTIIDTMVKLKKEPIHLLLVGGSEKVQDAINDAIKAGANITYKKWVPFEELPKYMQDADLCLGGPFGGTVQSRYVITGKTFQFLQMGRPTVIGKNEESGIFTDKQDSILVDQNDPKALADALLWAKVNRNKLEAIGESGKKLYEAKLSNRIISKQLKDLFAKL